MTKEKERLFEMFRENKISEEDYKLLLAALDKKSSRISSLLFLAVNPFQKIAGFYSLAIGLIVIVIMSYFGVIAKVNFPGILACLNADVLINTKVKINFLLLFYQNLVSWIVLAALFLIAAVICKQKKIRVIDFFGTLAMSRFPYLILAAFLSILRIVNPSFMNVDITKGFPLHPSMMMIMFSFFVLSCGIWQATTYFYALKESSGLMGKKLWISYIATLIIGDVISSPLSMIFF